MVTWPVGVILGDRLGVAAVTDRTDQPGQMQASAMPDAPCGSSPVIDRAEPSRRPAGR